MVSQITDYEEIHRRAEVFFDEGRQLLNGIYYEYPYSGAEGHPFLGDREFRKGSVVFHSRLHEDVMIRYDIYHRQLLARPDPEDPMLVIQLATLFVSEFHLDEMHFRKLYDGGGKEHFFQVVWEGKEVKCYSGWYKLRYKSYDEGDHTTYRFSEEKKRDYVLIGDRLSVIRNNRSFVRLFPVDARSSLKGFLRSEHIRIERASPEALAEVMQFGESLLQLKKNQGETG